MKDFPQELRGRYEADARLFHCFDGIKQPKSSEKPGTAHMVQTRDNLPLNDESVKGYIIYVTVKQDELLVFLKCGH